MSSRVSKAHTLRSRLYSNAQMINRQLELTIFNNSEGLWLDSLNIFIEALPLKLSDFHHKTKEDMNEQII